MNSNRSKSLEVRVRPQVVRRAVEASVERVERGAVATSKRSPVGLEGSLDPVDRVGGLGHRVAAVVTSNPRDAERRHARGSCRIASNRNASPGMVSAPAMCNRRHRGANESDLASRTQTRARR